MAVLSSLNLMLSGVEFTEKECKIFIWLNKEKFLCGEVTPLERRLLRV
jgi:hypothetical protein